MNLRVVILKVVNHKPLSRAPIFVTIKPESSKKLSANLNLLLLG